MSLKMDGPRPDPAQGVFETTLVIGGRAVAVGAHLERLAASLSELYGLEPPADAEQLIAEGAEGTMLGRLRLTVAPGAAATVAVANVDEELVFPDWERAVELAPVVVPGGIGPHKWADRRLLSAAEADVAPAVPLVVDSDGAVLEASRGSLFVVRDGALVTPPADGRLLPGITRTQAIHAARALGIELREETVSAGALASADEIFLTGAVRGVEPVRACEGVAEWDSGQVRAQVAAELRRTWLD
jgi:para-aminobenzoate synthetase / 4-amino-4-deoxychorismate lyase